MRTPQEETACCCMFHQRSATEAWSHRSPKWHTGTRWARAPGPGHPLAGRLHCAEAWRGICSWVPTPEFYPSCTCHILKKKIWYFLVINFVEIECGSYQGIHCIFISNVYFSFQKTKKNHPKVFTSRTASGASYWPYHQNSPFDMTSNHISQKHVCDCFYFSYTHMMLGCIVCHE